MVSAGPSDCFCCAHAADASTHKTARMLQLTLFTRLLLTACFYRHGRIRPLFPQEKEKSERNGGDRLQNSTPRPAGLATRSRLLGLRYGASFSKAASTLTPFAARNWSTLPCSTK